MKHNTVASFHEIKGRFSARKRRALAITETLETSEEGSLDIDFMKATNNIKSTFCQPCTIYRTEINCRLTEKDELIKTLNIFREQTNQLILHIEIFTANLQNLENNIIPIRIRSQ